MSKKPASRSAAARDLPTGKDSAAPAKVQRIAFGVRLPPDLIKDVRREALERDQTVQDFTEIALRTALGR
jgi:hypothetical protein